MNTGKKIFLNTLYQMIGKVSTSVFGVISFAFLARYLQEQLGEYALISSFVGFIVVFADFGLGTLLTRELSAGRGGEKYVSYIFSLRFFLSTIASILGSIVIFFFPYSYEVKLGVVVLVFSNIFYLLSATIWAIFQAKLQFEKMVLSQIISSFASCLLVIFGVFLRLPLLFYVFSASIGILISYIIAYSLYGNTIKLNINKVAFIKILKEAWPFGAGVIFSFIYFKIDSLILPYFYNPAIHPDLGYYSTAYKIFEVVMVFGGYFTATLFPVFSANLYNKKFINNFYKYMIYTLVIAIIANAILFLFARTFILILGGENFIPSVKSLQILSFAVFASILSGFFLNIAVAGRRQLLILKYSIVIAFVNIFLNIFIIPTLSFIGASITTVITQFLILFAYIYISIIVIKSKSTDFEDEKR